MATKTFLGGTIPIYSINYDFIPNSIQGEKVLWVTSQFPPQHLKVGMYVRIEPLSTDFVVPRTTLQVEDIIGARIVLSTKPVPLDDMLNYASYGIVRYTGGNPRPRSYIRSVDHKSDWSPLDHGGQWGYATRNHDGAPIGTYRNWNYGSGHPVGLLVY